MSPTSDPPSAPNVSGRIYEGRPESLEPPVGRRGLRGPTACIALLYVGLALAALLLRAL